MHKKLSEARLCLDLQPLSGLITFYETGFGGSYGHGRGKKRMDSSRAQPVAYVNGQGSRSEGCTDYGNEWEGSI